MGGPDRRRERAMAACPVQGLKQTGGGSQMGNCAGIDWASEKHDVLIEDPAGERLLAHDGFA